MLHIGENDQVQIYRGSPYGSLGAGLYGIGNGGVGDESCLFWVQNLADEEATLQIAFDNWWDGTDYPYSVSLQDQYFMVRYSLDGMLWKPAGFVYDRETTPRGTYMTQFLVPLAARQRVYLTMRGTVLGCRIPNKSECLEFYNYYDSLDYFTGLFTAYSMHFRLNVPHSIGGRLISLVGSCSTPKSLERNININGDISHREARFTAFFEGDDTLVDASELTLPDYGRADGAFAFCRMFADCTALEGAPRFKQTMYPIAACYEMFAGCTSLKDTGNFADFDKKANDFAFCRMFAGCSALTPPEDVRITPTRYPDALHPDDDMFIDCGTSTGTSDTSTGTSGTTQGGTAIGGVGNVVAVKYLHLSSI